MEVESARALVGKCSTFFSVGSHEVAIQSLSHYRNSHRATTVVPISVQRVLQLRNGVGVVGGEVDVLDVVPAAHSRI
jgi:hypothetical protein